MLGPGVLSKNAQKMIAEHLKTRASCRVNINTCCNQPDFE
jgi:hypothetical protein